MGVKALTDNLIFSIRNAAFSPQDYLQRKEHRVTTLSLPEDKTPPQLQPAACACSEDIMQLEDCGDKQLLLQPQALSMNPEEFPPLTRGMEPVSPSRDSDLESDTSPFLALPQSFTATPQNTRLPVSLPPLSSPSPPHHPLHHLRHYSLHYPHYPLHQSLTHRRLSCPLNTSFIMPFTMPPPPSSPPQLHHQSSANARHHPHPRLANLFLYSPHQHHYYHASARLRPHPRPANLTLALSQTGFFGQNRT
ncbi:hypothetical protein AAFF_G00046940 [Aldrovandia affinis]|uniref:Uncharacterized protein n=1 Tax=Aldrovandia affinis TaxID=143900 RepID=A0AAD7R1W7_9TELE|nr:hypothetical protein AAFF_G00046940 [Aldrovandia affinis]